MSQPRDASRLPAADPRAEPDDAAVECAAGAMKAAASRLAETAARAQRRVSRSGDKFAAIRLAPPAKP